MRPGRSTVWAERRPPGDTVSVAVIRRAAVILVVLLIIISFVLPLLATLAE